MRTRKVTPGTRLVTKHTATACRAILRTPIGTEPDRIALRRAVIAHGREDRVSNAFHDRIAGILRDLAPAAARHRDTMDIIARGMTYLDSDGRAA